MILGQTELQFDSNQQLQSFMSVFKYEKPQVTEGIFLLGRTF